GGKVIDRVSNYTTVYSGAASAGFQIRSNSTTNILLTMLDGGNLGVGTTSPQAKLDVAGEGSFGSMRVNAVADGDTSLTLDEAGTTRWTLFNDGDNADRLYITDQDGDNGLYLDQDATSWSANSDIRLKENIVTVDGALDKVLALSGVKYNFIGTDRTEIGLIAQDVQAAGLGELVSVGKNGYLGVSYDRLAPVLIE